MAVTFPDPITFFASSEITAGVTSTVPHEVTEGTTLLLVISGFRANEEVVSVERGAQDLALVLDIDDSTSSAHVTVEVWGIVNPTVGIDDVIVTASSQFDACHWIAILNVHGTEVASLGAAIVALTTDFNNSAATDNNVHASGGNAGNKLLFVGAGQGDDMIPATNDAGFAELLEDHTGGGAGNSADQSAYIAEGDAPSAIEVTWNTTDENVGALFELVAAASVNLRAIVHYRRMMGMQ